MDTTIATITAYIKAMPKAYQPLLEELRQLILKAAPKETTETISYGMPTFRHHGNLIHFALNKQHLGIYPGPGAIAHVGDKIKNYKTSKGTIQLPLDAPLPKQLIKDLVKFNAERLKDKAGPNWHISRGNWPEAEKRMQKIIEKTGLTKEFKWGSDIYTYNGRNVIGWGGFKQFFSLWFYNGVFLEDKDKVLVSGSEGKTKGLRQWRFTDVKEMDEKKILAYIKESIQTVKDGKEIKPEKSVAKKPTGLLKKALDEDTKFKDAFAKITPGRQKEYIAYIEEAKQEATKLSRIEKMKSLIFDGKGLHDRYKR